MMKAITYCLCLLFAVSFGNSRAQGIINGDPIFGNGSFWELGFTSLANPLSDRAFYSTTRNTGLSPTRTELTRQSSFMQRSYFRVNTALSKQWLLYFMGDVAIHQYTFGSREYFSDGSLFRLNQYVDNGPSTSFQQSLSIGTIYQRPMNEKMKWRVGGGMGLMMGIFEEEIPWENTGFSLLPSLIGSVRLIGNVETGIDFQLSEQPNRVHLIVSSVLHHAFLHDPTILNHHLSTHVGLQVGLRFGFQSKNQVQRRSDILGF